MSIASDLLAAYIEAEKKCLLGQRVRMGDRDLTRADLQFIQKERLRLEAVVARENAPGRKGWGAVGSFTGCRDGRVPWSEDR